MKIEIPVAVDWWNSRMEEPLGVHVFPNRLSARIRADPNLIHYEGHAPIYGDRMLKGEAPVPDFQGNRPADFFRNQVTRLMSLCHVPDQI